MALLVCRKCGTKFSVGAPFCPQCTAEDAYIEGTEEESTMPRNTVAGASLGVQHPEYVEGGPVPPVVPEGVPLDAPIDELTAIVEAAASTDDEPVDDTVVTDPAADEPVVVDDESTTSVKAAPKKATRK